jgi:exopolyphosphatase/guanosine-5'-triphosphate,3'-diphosphate pyrophosphatase
MPLIPSTLFASKQKKAAALLKAGQPEQPAVPKLKLAAIDIGSNAVRCQIVSVLQHHGRPYFKKVEYVRYAMRLGEDVFQFGYITEPKRLKFMKLLQALKLLMEVHDVDAYQICATSAMREATNSRKIGKQVFDKLGMKIEIIEGEQEAYLINKVITNSLDEKGYIHIDVGGGSTELNLYVNREKIASRSFEVGSIRSNQGKDSQLIRSQMKAWVKEHAAKCNLYRAIGTGGNINKIHELAHIVGNRPLMRSRIKKVSDMVSGMSMEERINELLLNPDRADVLVPAADIYLSVMQWASVRSMVVPNVGLKDGMLQVLFERVTSADPLAQSAVTDEAEEGWE